MIAFFSGLFRNPAAERIREFIDQATGLGLLIEDRDNAIDMLDHNELGCAFDIVVTQLYEYNVPINRAFLEFAHEIGDAMKIDRRDYEFLEKLAQEDHIGGWEKA